MSYRRAPYIQRFYVDAIDASTGDKQGPGPAFNVISVSWTEALDEAGQFAMSYPANDARCNELLSEGTYIQVAVGPFGVASREVQDLVMVKAIIQEISLAITEEGQSIRQATGLLLLADLSLLNTGYNRHYDDADVSSEIIGTDATATSLLGGTGWTQGTVEDVGKVTIFYDAETRLRALTLLGEQIGRHIRAGSLTSKTIDFGLFGTSSGYRITNIHHYFVQQATIENVGWIASGQVGSVSADIYNRLLPLGKDRFDLRDANIYQIDIEDPASAAITNATNAAPIVITSAGHGLSTSDYVRVSDVGGNDAANGDWQITVLTVDTFSLDGSSGSGAYTSGGSWVLLEIAQIKTRTSQGPTGASTTTVGAITGGDTSFVVTSATGIAESDELWLGDETDWSQDHEIVIVESIAGTTISVLDGIANSYAGGTTVIRNPQFYIEDTSSQSTYGVREDCPQFAWIAPLTQGDQYAEQQRAADSLYTAARAQLIRHKEIYKSYIFNVIALPRSIRVGDKLRVVFRGTDALFSPSVPWVDIDDDFYIIRVTRTLNQDGTEQSEVEVANVNRPAPNNTQLILFNLDTYRWLGLK